MTTYQEIISGKTRTKEEVLQEQQNYQAEQQKYEASWKQWSEEIWTLEFLRKIDDLLEELDMRIDANLRNGVEKDEVLLAAMEQSTLKRVVQLVKTGQYDSKGNLLYK